MVYPCFSDDDEEAQNFFGGGGSPAAMKRLLKGLYKSQSIFADEQHQEMSRVMRKPTFCICENKDADQLRGDREADQRLCFRYIDSTIPPLSKSEISSRWPSFVAVQPGLCRSRSETRTLLFS